ncbi:MAG: N-acetylmuramoyl-L-alanine amidase, partial [Nitrospirales bacterium]
MRFRPFFSLFIRLVTLFLALPSMSQGMDRPLLSLSQPTSSAFLYETASRSSKIQTQNIRTHRHKKFTRIVLDLSGELTPGPKESRTSTHFQIELPNTTISTDITAKLTDKKFPSDLTLTPASPGSILLSVPMQDWKRYKWYLLNNPSRLVLDLYPSSKTGEIVQASPAPESPIPAKAPEVIVPPPPVKRDFVIVLDPGHGGKDPGALGKSGTREKDAVLSIALQLRDILQKEPSVKVLMTREKDEFIELEDRAKFANQEKADLFLS